MEYFIKEEPEQELPKVRTKEFNDLASAFFGGKPKQETLEEAVKKYYEENIDQSNIPREHYEWEIQELMLGFAYKWQQEQDKNKYIEEEMLKMLHKFGFDYTYNYKGEKTIYEWIPEWFEEYKRLLTI